MENPLKATETLGRGVHNPFLTCCVAGWNRSIYLMVVKDD